MQSIQIVQLQIPLLAMVNLIASSTQSLYNKLIFKVVILKSELGLDPLTPAKPILIDYDYHQISFATKTIKTILTVTSCLSNYGS